MALKGQAFQPIVAPRQLTLPKPTGFSTTPGVTAPASPAAIAQGLPPDPVYTRQTGGALNRYQGALAENQYQRGQINNQYGFTDLSNPYNRAAMLERSYKEGQAGTVNSRAAQGQLYSGSTQAALNQGTFQYGQNVDALRRQYDAALHGLTQADLSARYGYEDTLTAAQADRLGRASQLTPEPTVPPTAARRTAAPVPTKGRAYTFRRTSRNNTALQQAIARQRNTRGIPRI